MINVDARAAKYPPRCGCGVHGNHRFGRAEREDLRGSAGWPGSVSTSRRRPGCDRVARLRRTHGRGARDWAQDRAEALTHDRAQYVASLAAVLRPAGVCSFVCFSNWQPGTWGPRRVRAEEFGQLRGVRQSPARLTVPPHRARHWLAARAHAPPEARRSSPARTAPASAGSRSVRTDTARLSGLPGTPRGLRARTDHRSHSFLRYLPFRCRARYPR